MPGERAINPVSPNAGGRAAHRLDLSDADLLRQCDVDTYRASGPGGQHRNKVSSAVRLRHRPTGIAVTATESRSQHENRARALRRLRRAIALEVRTPVDVHRWRPSQPLAGCISREGRLCVGKRDARYDRAVSEILDVLVSCDMKVSLGAGSIGVSTANLVAFLKNDTKLWAKANELRTLAGHAPLR